MLLFFCPPPDFEFQPPIREMRTRTEVHADARGNGVGMLLRNWHPWSLVFRGVGREIEGAGSFESLLHRHILQTQTPGFLTRAGGLWFLAFLNTGLDTVRCAPAPVSVTDFLQSSPAYNHSNPAGPERSKRALAALHRFPARSGESSCRLGEG